MSANNDKETPMIEDATEATPEAARTRKPRAAPEPKSRKRGTPSYYRLRLTKEMSALVARIHAETSMPLVQIIRALEDETNGYLSGKLAQIVLERTRSKLLPFLPGADA